MELLLLLHLLQINEGHGAFRRLLSAFHKHAPVVGNGKLAVESGWKVAGFDMDCDIKLAVGLPAEDAVGRRDIRIIAPNRRADVPVMSDKVVGWVESNPAKVRQKNVDPGMRRVGH